MTCPVLANSVDPDQLASLEAKLDPDQLASLEANWSGSALFVIKYVTLYKKNPGSSNLIGGKLEVGVASLFSMRKVNWNYGWLELPEVWREETVHS